ncbi:carboxynorspermidine decarboxylase [Methylobacter tundripaludum]|uniref:Carboxynorspermidine/carboxyspermidine decarboxylase n=1 Tax=Methylobacter tundripaludum TaxID=173365 RepID=A0A2S6GQ06_9GAMM|nr:carboxynorspermidine decarboxylase [Methylobacter tundripaludum]PPK67277.1 carboxynorspermidine decarboxylase [Methylobacter tundripaludum]
MDFQVLKDSVYSSPAFVLDETEAAKALAMLADLRNQCGCKVLYSIKALPFSAVLDMAKPFVDGFSASSLFEARLAGEVLSGQGSIHLTTPGIKTDELDELSLLCSHISFNSLTQYQRYAETAGALTSIGLRINPKLSFLHDDRFDPCRQHSKLGVAIEELSRSIGLDQIQGLHIHNVFSSTDFTPLIKTVEKLQHYLGIGLAELEWLNLGGGYLFGQIEDHRPFIELVKKLKNDFGLEVYIEPGKAIVGQAGHLVATVIDRFVSDGETIAILDTSINHHPEVFEYQRQPELHEHDPDGQYSAILAGCTCLAGDVFGKYCFKAPLAVGDKVVFNNVGAYTLIKANRFNGYNLPDIYVSNSLRVKKLKHYDYQDYRRQWLAD